MSCSSGKKYLVPQVFKKFLRPGGKDESSTEPPLWHILTKKMRCEANTGSFKSGLKTNTIVYGRVPILVNF